MRARSRQSMSWVGPKKPGEVGRMSTPELDSYISILRLRLSCAQGQGAKSVSKALEVALKIRALR